MDVLIEGRCRHLDDGAGMAGRDPGWTTRPPVNNFGALRAWHAKNCSRRNLGLTVAGRKTSATLRWLFATPHSGLWRSARHGGPRRRCPRLTQHGHLQRDIYLHWPQCACLTKSPASRHAPLTCYRLSPLGSPRAARGGSAADAAEPSRHLHRHRPRDNVLVRRGLRGRRDRRDTKSCWPVDHAFCGLRAGQQRQQRRRAVRGRQRAADGGEDAGHAPLRWQALHRQAVRRRARPDRVGRAAFRPHARVQHDPAAVGGAAEADDGRAAADVRGRAHRRDDRARAAAAGRGLCGA
eukprot:scaffold66234_cov62-Phaeocystis_antarctica.AAC.4